MPARSWLRGECMMRLLLILVFLAILVSCGKNESINGESLASKVIIGNLDWKDWSKTAFAGTENLLVARNARTVGYLDIPAVESRCTAFLIDVDVVMTNRHCITKAQDADGATVTFGYEADKKIKRIKYLCDEFIDNNEEVDVALLRCKGRPGDKFDTVEFSTSTLKKGDELYVIHQNCDYFTNQKCDWTKKISQGKTVGSKNSMEFIHNADTFGGSSGSPVFSRKTHQLIGLHHAGMGNMGDGRGTENYAVKTSQVLKFLKTAHPEIQIRFAVKK